MLSDEELAAIKRDIPALLAYVRELWKVDRLNRLEQDDAAEIRACAEGLGSGLAATGAADAAGRHNMTDLFTQPAPPPPCDARTAAERAVIEAAKEWRQYTYPEQARKLARAVDRLNRLENHDERRRTGGD